MANEPVRNASAAVREAARGLRRTATPAERVLWEALRAKRLEGLKFRRQHPVGRFVLDFYCPAHRLAVEVDGDVHDEQRDRDAARTAEIEAFGCRVLRFRNDEVLNDLASVLARIRSVVNGG
jgi:very-short-patch-repair endonuclease